MKPLRLFNPPLPAAYEERRDALPNDLRDYVAECQLEYRRQTAWRLPKFDPLLVTGFGVAAPGVVTVWLQPVTISQLATSIVTTSILIGAPLYAFIMEPAIRQEKAEMQFTENLQAVGLKDIRNYLPKPQTETRRRRVPAPAKPRR